MAFGDGVKNFFGVSTVKIELDCPGFFSVDQGTFDGLLILTGLRDQEISKVWVEFIEERERDDGSIYPNLVGSDILLNNQTVPLREGETLSAEFSVPLDIEMTAVDKLKLKDGAAGVLGKWASMVDFESVAEGNGLLEAVGSWAGLDEPPKEYKIVAGVDVKSTEWGCFDPKVEKKLTRADWGPLRTERKEKS